MKLNSELDFQAFKLHLESEEKEEGILYLERVCEETRILAVQIKPRVKNEGNSDRKENREVKEEQNDQIENRGKIEGDEEGNLGRSDEEEKSSSLSSESSIKARQPFPFSLEKQPE